MQRRHWYHLTGLLFLSLAVRLAAIDSVGMWVDHGFYAYDSRLILEGQRPFVDFLGRSPAFLYLLAGYRALVGYSPTALRVGLSILWTLTGLPIYGLARDFSDHRSALVATAAGLLLPFGVVYGLWFNTMSLAVLGYLTALWLVVVQDTLPAWLVAGIALAVAFLSRRSVVVMGPVLLVYLGVRYNHGEYSLAASARRIGSVAAGGIVTLAVGYLALGQSLSTAWQLFEIHALNLFLTTGRGGWPMVGVTVEHVGNNIEGGRIPILNDFCQLCGRWTARTFAKGLLVTVPAVGIVTGVSLSTLSERYLDQRMVPYLTVPLIALAGWAAVLSALSGYWLRVGTVLSLVLLCVVAYRAPTLPLRLRERPALLAIVLTVGAFIAGYLYRERVLHVYYGMDFWVLLAMLAGLAGIALWRRCDRPLRVVLTLALVLGVVTSGAAAYPLTNIVVDDNSAGWFTPALTEEYAEDINERTNPSDIVLTKTATYLGGTHARMPLDDSRSTGHIYSTFAHRGGAPLDRLYANLSDGMADGRVALVIRDSLMRDLIADNETTTRLFENNYCKVQSEETQRLYAQTNATLFAYGNCPESQRPVVNSSA